MLRVTIDRLLDTRAGRLWSGGDAMMWHPVRGVVGFTLPKNLTSDGLLPVASLVERLVSERRGANTVVMDFSRVTSEGCDKHTLSAFHRFALEPLVQHAPRVAKAVLVGGSGVAQCALLGSLVAARPQFAWEVFPSLSSALEAMGSPSPEWVGEVLSAVNSELTPLGLVSRVRAVVGEDPRRSLRDVAAQLSIAPRSLQRALSDVATTFGDERLDVRLELAASRLARTTQKVSAIARDVGYDSLAHFFSVFRTRFGISPSEFRARHSTLEPS